MKLKLLALIALAGLAGCGAQQDGGGEEEGVQGFHAHILAG